MLARRLFQVSLGCLVWSLAACSEPRPRSPSKSDEVPANSLDDARLHGAAGKEETPGSDPSQPLTTKVGETPLDPDALASGGGGTASGGAAPSGKPAGKPGKQEPAGKGAVSRAECDKAFDKYLQLEMAQNPQLKDLPPEVLAQVKEQGRQKHGEAPCTATRAQYNCAMAAGSTAAWQRCMK